MDYLPSNILFAQQKEFLWCKSLLVKMYWKSETFSINTVYSAAGPSQISGITELNEGIALKCLHFTGKKLESQGGYLKIT